MATKIRLQRHGRKSYAFYSIVIADVRAPRDGKFIEKIGTYNPNTNPATVDLKFDRALDWVLKGAQPTDTVRNILSREGVYMKKHLLGGVAKGAFDEATAEARFNAWKENKQNGLAALKTKEEEAKKAAAKARLEAEKKVNEEIAKKVAEKKAAVRHAGQRRSQGLRKIHIVKAGNGNVLSDQKVVSPTDAVSGFCHIIVRESDRFKTRVVVQESFHELIDIFGIVAVDDHVFRDRKTVFFHGVAVGGKALVGVTVVLRTADECDLLIMMEIEQMLHAAAGAVVIVRDQIRGIR